MHRLFTDLLIGADQVDVGTWHAMDVSGRPELVTREVPAHFTLWIPPTVEELQGLYKPNLPWAEDHFQERVAGQPLNPGEQWKNWPWQSQMDKHKPEVFTHTYMERYWSKRANRQEGELRDTGGDWLEENPTTRGIRYAYGDLNDVVALLSRSPSTRQAYLPVWFPEDTGAIHRGRVPCSLGYHFLLRNNRLGCHYFIRSCDFVRHFRDDLYLTARLTQWMIQAVNRWYNDHDAIPAVGWNGGNVRPGNLTFTCPSLHIMEGDRDKLIRERSKTE